MTRERWRAAGLVGLLGVVFLVGPWAIVLAAAAFCVPRVRRFVRAPRLTRVSLRRGGVAGAGLVALVAAVLIIPDGVLPIPPGAGSLVTPGYVGRPAFAQPLSLDVPRNPSLAEGGAGAAHNDTWSTDAYAGPGPLGESPRVATAWFGLTDCEQLALDGQGRLISQCVTARGRILQVVDPETMRPLASIELMDSCGAFYLDHLGRAVVLSGREVLVVETSDGRDQPDLTVEATYDLTEGVPTGDCLVALLPDWAGRIWWSTRAGRVGFVEPGTGRVRSLSLDEGIATSLSIDRSGGVYVVTDRALYRVQVDAAQRPQIAWRTIYDSGTTMKTGQASQGSGTTPTVLPGGLVAITDNAEPRMHVQFYRADNGRLVCQESVFEDGSSATDSSLTAVGSGSVVVRNSAGDTGRRSTLLGRAPSGGLARVDVTDGECAITWTNPEVASGSVPKLSLATGLLYATTKRPNLWGVNAWYLTAIDARTGRRIWSVRTGIGTLFDPHGSSILIGPEAAAYLATTAGLVRVRDREY